MLQEPVANYGTRKMNRNEHLSKMAGKKTPSVKTRVPWGVSHSQNSDQTLYAKDKEVCLMVEASTTSLYSVMCCQQFIHQNTSGKKEKEILSIALVIFLLTSV